MTVLVAYKVAADPAEASVGPDGVPDWSRARPAVSPDDPVAFALGRAVADAVGADLVGVSVGGAAVAAAATRKAALARGLDRALLVADDATLGWDRGRVAAALAALVRREPASDLVLTGDASLDENAHVMSALLAAHLGWPCLQAVVGVAPADGGWLVTQAAGAGRRDVRVAGPVVVAVEPGAVPVGVPGLKELLAAARTPFTLLPPGEVLPGVSDAGVRAPRVVGRLRPAPRPRGHRMFEGPDAAAALVAALRADGAL